MEKLDKLCDLTDYLYHIALLVRNTKYENIRDSLAFVFNDVLLEINNEFEPKEKLGE